MTIIESFKIYELNRVMGSDKHLALELVHFPITRNDFTAERLAVDAFLENNRELLETAKPLL